VVPDVSVPRPWYFPSIGEHATILERHGLAVVQATLFDRPTPLGDGEQGMRHWIEQFGADYLLAVPAERRARFVAKVGRLLRPSLFQDGAWTADYRRLRIMALKETS